MLAVTAIPSILSRVALGEANAVRECIDEYGGLIWSLARRFTRTSADAEDATQEIFLEIWIHAGRFDASRGSEKTFIAMIARRRLIDRWRQACTEPVASVDLESPELSLWIQSTDSTRNCVEIDEAFQALEQLPAAYRQVIELGCLFGWTHVQIATRLDLPLGTVKSLMRRGLLIIRDRLNGIEVKRVLRSPKNSHKQWSPVQVAAATS